jgi:hypothetical protein
VWAVAGPFLRLIARAQQSLQDSPQQQQKVAAGFAQKKNNRCRNHRHVSPVRAIGPKDSRPLIGAQEYEFVSGK